MQKKKSNRCLVEFPIIVAAAAGDTEAIQTILKFYEAYISYLSIRWFYDENGIARCYVDEEKKQMLEIKLIAKILDFEVVKLT